MSPNAVSTSVRGIGVAVITSMSGALPLAVIARRWWTPKRCCSSTIASTRSWKTTASWNSACVPMTMSIAPRCDAVEHVGALAALLAAGEDRRCAGRPLGERRDGRKMLAGEDLGRRHQRRLAAGLGGARHGEQRRPPSCRSRHRPAAGAACARARRDRRGSRPAPAPASRSANRAARRGSSPRSRRRRSAGARPAAATCARTSASEIWPASNSS